MSDIIRKALGGPAGKRVKLPVTRELLDRMGQCMVEAFSREAKKDFAKRGWSGEAQDGSPPIWDSFHYHIQGQKTVVVTSSFPHIGQMMGEDVPAQKMTWLTQQAKNANPSQFPLTPREHDLGMKRAGKVSQGGRLPLVVPMKDEGGTILFRTAPLTFNDAWVHPGIARFTFMQRAAKQGRERCIQMIKEEVRKQIVQGFSA